MTKVLLILSLLTLLGAGGLAVVNRGDFISTRTDKDAINKEIKKIKDDYDKNFETQFVDVDEEIKTNEKALVEAKSLFDLTSSNLVTVSRELAVEKAKESPLDEEIAEAEKLIEKFKDRFPGIDFASLPAKMEEMETQERELKAEEESLRAESAIVAKKIETNAGVITRLQEKQVERAKGVARNASQAVITAVNNEWGFVTINAGQAGWGDSQFPSARLARGPGDLPVGRCFDRKPPHGGQHRPQHAGERGDGASRRPGDLPEPPGVAGPLFPV